MPQYKIAAILGVVLLMIIVLVVVVAVVLSGPAGPPGASSSASAGSLSLTSAQSGTISTPSGASVYVPAGAVPTTDSGAVGTMVFSANQRSDVTPTFPQGFLPASPVYELGPEGFNFELPVKITLPISSGIDPNSVGGLAYFDEASQKWIRVPGSVDPTTGTVSAYTTHFSLWTTWSSTSWHDQMSATGGWIKVVNGHTYESGSYLGTSDHCRGKPVTTTYGVCIENWVPKNAADATWWNAVDMLLMAHDQPLRESETWVPPGTFDLVEILAVSEVNHDPLYLPCYAKYWRNIGSTPINVGQTKTFTGGTLGNMANWTTATDENPPPCWGVRTTAVGTGDVQITLTWHSSIDLDLHVTDPNSEEIYYSHMQSASGGQLDRDNRCSGFEMGRPENIYWPAGGAPRGQYKVTVVYYNSCANSGPTPWTVRVISKGQASTYSGTIGTSGDEQDVTTFTV